MWCVWYSVVGTEDTIQKMCEHWDYTAPSQIKLIKLTLDLCLIISSVYLKAKDPMCDWFPGLRKTARVRYRSRSTFYSYI